MQTSFSLRQPLADDIGAAVALGYFDGVHIGHRAVIGAAVDYAKANACKAAVFTFSINRKNTKGSALLSLNQRILRIEETGTDILLCPSFDDVCDLSAQEFVTDILCGALNAKAVFCGADYRFGKNAAGDIKTLEKLCAEKGVSVTSVPTMLWQGETVSSTRIKKCLAEGNIEQVNKMLGKNYAVDFAVVHGKRIGHTMGFPTINQVYPNGTIIPKSGVYITKTYIDGAGYPSATGIGSRPTVNGNGITCETFINDFSGDLYGKSVTVEFYARLADTKKFADVDALAAAIKEYAEKSRLYFKQNA